MFELEELKQKSLAVKLGILPVYGEEDVKEAERLEFYGVLGRSGDSFCPDTPPPWTDS